MISRPQVIAFRADASLEIGTGHIMRCLTLADAVRAEGFDCHFICRAHRGDRIATIRERGHAVHVLPNTTLENEDESDNAPLSHGHWLGSSWRADARESGRIIAAIDPAWLVVDHYALDSRWEAAVKPSGCRLLVIDDLADRQHIADLLLDQNLGRKSEDYAGLVSNRCRCLIGPRYALLRPEFAQFRQASLKRRRKPQLKRLLVTLGGVDKDNVTERVLHALRGCPLPDGCQIDVVMGGTAPWLEQVRIEAAAMPWPTQVLVDIKDMAQRMTEADIAVGAAGATSWERCYLGLPTILGVLADNQRPAAVAIKQAGAALLLDLDTTTSLNEHLAAALTSFADSSHLAKMAMRAAAIVDGAGITRVRTALKVKVIS